VAATFDREADEIVEVRVGGEVIRATPEHPFYVAGTGWVVAANLANGSRLMTKDGTTVRVESVTRRTGNFKVYNFEVEHSHTYFVGKLGLLVHNTPCNPKDVKALQTGASGTSVEVGSKAEADALLKEAFPDYQKVNGIGSQDALGPRRARKIERFKEGGAYHKDYGIDSQTGRVYGHGGSNPHGEFPHINIKRKDGAKVIINIVGK
jgi:hypothetical protein